MIFKIKNNKRKISIVFRKIKPVVPFFLANDDFSRMCQIILDIDIASSRFIYYELCHIISTVQLWHEFNLISIVP